ncbi:MAG: hypothetical protein ACYST6_00075 [Planctomycetota bacterium]|jgi:hypothetical protein
MPAGSNDKLEDRVLETANRLRLVQVDFADEGEQTRAEYLCEEIERAMKTILPQERSEFLERLLARFPIGERGAQPALEKPEVESSPVIEADKLTDADFLVGHLLEILPTLSSNQKEGFANSLRQAGLPALSGQDSPDYCPQAIQTLKTELTVGNAQDFDGTRFVELIILLAGCVCKLEPLVWNTWRKLSPRSSLRPPGALKKTMGQFLCQEPEASREQVDMQLKLLQRLIAAIITSISRVGSQFAKRHLAKFSPSEIEALVRMEHGSVFVSHEVKCWRKYLELADTLNEDSTETEIVRSIVDCVESLMKGTGQQR